MLLFYRKLRDENLCLFVDQCYLSEYISWSAYLNTCVHADVQVHTMLEQFYFIGVLEKHQMI